MRLGSSVFKSRLLVRYLKSVIRDVLLDGDVWTRRQSLDDEPRMWDKTHYVVLLLLDSIVSTCATSGFRFGFRSAECLVAGGDTELIGRGVAQTASLMQRSLYIDSILF